MPNKEKLRRESVIDGILRSLDSTAFIGRYKALPEPHPQTCQWIFNPDLDQGEICRWDDFSERLEHSDGLYWIHGKAGSGKSTLMKYIANSPLTRTHLSKWTGTSKLFTVHFYFWDLGTESLHKSQEELFRSLFQILRELPHVIHVIFHEQWAAIYAARTFSQRRR